MAVDDIVISHHLRTVLIIGVTIYALVKVRQRYGKTAKRKLYAFMLNRMIPKYNEKMATRKRKLFTTMHDMQAQLSRPLIVLEVGAGAGANFEFYPDGCKLMCVEPNPEFESYLKNNLKKHPHIRESEFVLGEGEDMSGVDSESVDVVVCTLVLCTVRSVEATLQEVLRILKPGGKFYYLEHVCAKQKTWTQRIQTFLNPMWSFIADGCQLNRETWKNVDEAGFTSVEHQQFMAPFGWYAFVMHPHLIGIATK